MTAVFIISALAGLALVLALDFTLGRLRHTPLRRRLGKTAPLAAAAPVRAGPGEKGPWLALQYFLISAGLTLPARTVVLVPAALAAGTCVLLFAFTGQLLLPLAAGLTLLGAPVAYLLWKRAQIRRRIVAGLPEAIGMVVRSLRIGMGVDAALKEAGDAVTGPLGTEIIIIYREMAVGIPFEEAFQGFEQRYATLPDVKMFCTAFILQRETGGNLAELLEALAATIRNRFSFRRQVRTYTAEARTSAIIISVLPLLFALVAWAMNPDYLSALTGTALGRLMIWAALALEAAGFLVMRQMAKVKI